MVRATAAKRVRICLDEGVPEFCRICPDTAIPIPLCHRRLAPTWSCRIDSMASTHLTERIQMRRVSGLAAVAAITLLPALATAQQQAGDVSRAVAGGGIMVPGWQAVLDPKEAGAGATIAQSMLSKEGNDLKVTT